MSKLNLLIFIVSVFAVVSCQEAHTPKPKGYNRFDLPSHTYQQLENHHPFTFEYSSHAKLSPHTSWMAEPHWIDLDYSDLNASVELTYKDLTKDKKKLDGILADAHKLTNKHNVKAYSIEQSLIKTPKGYTASIYELQGEVPSQFQFFVTDSTHHFLRGALYFPVSTKNDSLAPAIEYIKQDIMQMLNTLEWKNEWKERK